MRLETLPQEKPYNFCVLKTKFSAPFHTCLLGWLKVAALFCTFQSMKNANPQRTLYPHLFSFAISCSGRLRERSKKLLQESLQKIRLNSLVQLSRATG